MKIHNIKDFYRGWFVGDFSPTSYTTKDFEVGLINHKKGEFWPAHYHKLSTEINLLIEGEMIINETKLFSGDIFIIEPNEVSKPEFLTDCKLVVIKTPSIPSDKYLI